MKLISLQMHNFRQFYGTTPLIIFASDIANVTVFHAENGAGKTALREN
ncbi:MAG: AAA family ATPase [Pontiellaceae bacterium]|nr:AAA family ATPase [Pontiellaceae bacterium]